MQPYRNLSIWGFIVLVALHVWVYSGEAANSDIYQEGMCKMVEEGYYPPEFCIK